MERIFFVIAGAPVRLVDILAGSAAFAALLLLAIAFGLLRGAAARRGEAAASAERQREIDDKMADLARASAEMTGRMQTVAEVLGARQADFARIVGERLDQVGSRVGQGIEASGKSTGEQLSKLAERLAVIDAAQAKLTSLTSEVVGLKDILANKQARGAFGQGRLEAIIRDALPSSAFAFQHTLSNRNRPDCVIRLPGDDRVMVVDAKFPLEAFSALKEAAGEEAQKQAATRVRGDVGKHIRDIAERYFVPGETQDIAILFVPSESLYADLSEHFEDVIQKAHRSRIIIVSPSLLMMAVQVMQAIVRDARVREQAHQIQDEVRRLVEDVGRLRERVGKLDTHFRQAQDDVAQIGISADKVAKRGERIDQMDFAERPAVTPNAGVADGFRKGRGIGRKTPLTPPRALPTSHPPHAIMRGIGAGRMMTRERVGYFAVLIGATLLMASSFIAGKILLTAGVPSFLLIGWRFLLATFATVPFVLLGGRGLLPTLFPPHLSRHGWLMVALIGLLQTAGVMSLLFLGLRTVSASTAAILMFTNPLWTALLGRLFLGESLSGSRVLGLVLGISGVAVALGASGLASEPVGGELLVLAAAMCFAAGVIVNKRGALVMNVWALTFWNMLIATMILLAFAFARGEEWPDSLSLADWAWFAWLAIPGSTIAFGFWFVALRRGGATRTSGYLFLVPLFTVLMSAVILRTHLSVPQGVGGVLVGLSLWLVNRQPSRAVAAVAPVARPR